tara:strand:+ start:2909 stop:3151 length:243 start_codon:yes stop_codon:yes gene_type:complete
MSNFLRRAVTVRNVAILAGVTVVAMYMEARSAYEAPKGFGDEVAILTNITGIDSLVKETVGEDCGCEQRQEMFNNYMPYE